MQTNQILDYTLNLVMALLITLCFDQSMHLYACILLILLTIPINITFKCFFFILFIHFLVVMLATAQLISSSMEVQFHKRAKDRW